MPNTGLSAQAAQLKQNTRTMSLIRESDFVGRGERILTADHQT